MTLSPPARELAALIRRHRLSYAMFNKIAHQARRHVGLKPIKSGRRIPQLLSDSSMRAFFNAIDATENLQHRVLFRFLLFTALRVSELTAIKIVDVDLEGGRVYVDSGKGDKDRYVLVRDDFKLVLSAYVQSLHGQTTYLFESRQKRRYSESRIRQIVKEYAEAAGVKERLYPHLLRHQLLTLLTKEGVPDAAIQLISGHASRESLAVYQHMSLEQIEPAYQRALRKLPEGI